MTAFPSIVSAAVELVNQAVARSGDGIVRVELNRHIRIVEFLDACEDGILRFGLTTPFIDLYSGRRSRVSKDARTITNWRNKSTFLRKAEPIVIVGTASGHAEAGLRRTPIVISETDILNRFARLGESWLYAASDLNGPALLFGALVAMTIDGKLDPIALDEYATICFGDRSRIHDLPQAELWRLGILPDPRVMDTRTPGTRLSLNYRTAEFLVSSPDSAADEREWLRLRQAAEEGNAVAIAARKFSETCDISHLARAPLDDVLLLLRSRGKGGPAPVLAPKAISLFDGLDDAVVGFLKEVRNGTTFWDVLTSTECHTSIEVQGKRIRIEMESSSENDADESEPASRSLWSLRKASANVEAAQLVSEERLRAAAAVNDQFLESGVSTDLANRLLSARRRIEPIERWSENMLEALLLSPSLLQAAEEYLHCWTVLTELVLNQRDQAHVSGLRQCLSLLDGDWEFAENSAIGEDFQSVELRPTHPFVLSPHVQLARHVEEREGSRGLGTQALWAVDRTVPAYPAVWTERTTLVHRRGSTRPFFARRGFKQRPETNSQSGMLDIVESYIGLHPYARNSLSLLLVDPPFGKGVPLALRTLARERDIRDLRVMVVHSDSDSTDWPGLADVVTDLGRVNDIETWAAGCLVTAHIGFVFQTSRAALASSHTGDYRPSRGMQNVLTVSAAPPPISLRDESGHEQIPFVSIQPCNANHVVMTMMKLARASDREDRFYQVEPMLNATDATEIQSLGRLSDWTVVATPSPIGMIPPRRFPDDSLVYLGREDSGAYGFFAYAQDIFSVRRHIQHRIADAPVQPVAEYLERQIERLALSVPNGILRIGRGQGDVTAQIGLMAASALAQNV